jgi:hypothetical protein
MLEARLCEAASSLCNPKLEPNTPEMKGQFKRDFNVYTRERVDISESAYPRQFSGIFTSTN